MDTSTGDSSSSLDDLLSGVSTIGAHLIEPGIRFIAVAGRLGRQAQFVAGLGGQFGEVVQLALPFENFFEADPRLTVLLEMLQAYALHEHKVQVTVGIDGGVSLQLVQLATDSL